MEVTRHMDHFLLTSVHYRLTYLQREREGHDAQVHSPSIVDDGLPAHV
ncbi:MAG: hypothetical protein K0S45_4030, partial [Nitrospira sp.]|nr:hypothetical protein [Nitrospira sp.]